MKRHASVAFRWGRAALWTLLGCVTWLAGCAHFGTGGTGELVIPSSTLRQIDTLELEAVPATDEEPEVPTTRPNPFADLADLELEVAEARALALEHNFGIRVDLLSPTVARQNITTEQARFEALFTTSASYLTADSPTASELEGSQFEQLSITPGLAIPLRTGGTINLQLPLNRSQTNNQFSILNPSYTSDAVLTLSQPLLRNAGVDANAAGIRLAFYGYQQSLARTKLAIIRLLADVDRAYWQVYAARQLLEVRLAEYELAVEQLGRARRRVAAGAVAQVEVLRAESSVADTLEQIIISENNVRTRQRTLKRLLNAPGLEIDGPTELIPVTDPSAFQYAAEDHDLAESAIANRMELVETELQIAAETASLRLAENGLLPVVTLDYGYTVNGLGGSFDDSFDQLADVDFEDHRVGLNVQVPLGNRAAIARVRQSLASRVQQIFAYEDRVLLIRQEVFDAADQLRSTWQRILAARRRVDLNARLYAAEVRQFENGLRTSTEVREAQTRLANAKASEIDAIAQYQINRVDLAFATGSVLGASGVVWEEAAVPPRR